MKRKSFMVLTAILFAVFIFSCKKQEYSLKQAITDQQSLTTKADSLRKLAGVIHYTINIVDGGDAVFTNGWYYDYSYGGKSGKGLASVGNAKVTASQYGKTYVVYADTVGVATIKDLRIGTISVQIEAAGFTKASYIAQLTPPFDATDTVTQSAWNLERYAATMIPLFPTAGTNQSTISGVVTYESDLTNNSAEKVSGVDVMAIIDASDYHFIDTYMIPSSNYYSFFQPKDFSFYGNIIKLAYNSAVAKATTDASGAFTLKVPATGSGLPMDIVVSDVSANQKLLMNTLSGIPVFGVQTVRTIFSSDYWPSDIPVVKAAYCTFSAPTGAGNLSQPTVVATAVARVSESGIVSVTPALAGSGYTQAPVIKISGTGQGAYATGVITAGRLTDVTLNSPGIGYTGTPTATVLPSETSVATATAVLGWSLTEINMTSTGSGYSSTPAVTITSNSGTGATAVANMSGYVATLTLTNQGSGYTATPDVTITGGNGINATASATMTTYNPIQSVYVPASVSLWTNRRLGTRIVPTAGNQGSGAQTDSTTLGTAGRVRPTGTVVITTAGSGYTSAPQVIISGGGGFGAVAHAVITAGAVTSIVIDNQGQGYTSLPTIAISAPVAGTQAVAVISLEYQVTGITVTSNGNGYASATTRVEVENAPASGVYVNATALYGIVPIYSMGVNILNILTAGDEFTSPPTVTITPSNGVVTSAATGTASILYKVKSITVANQGSGYEGTDYNLLIGAPPLGGSQASASINKGHGLLKRIILNTPGSGYTAVPNVLVSGGNPAQIATVTPTIANGAVTGFTFTPGSEYTSTPTLSIQTYLTAATATALANNLAGQIISIEVTNAGEGYGIAPVVEFVNAANSAGSGGAATAVVTGGRVTDINITAAGTQYYTAPTVVLRMPNYNTLAKADLTISSDGYVTGVTFDPVNDGGFGYLAVPAITIIPSVPGLGTGAVLNAEIKDSRVTKVWVVNRGSGYTGINRPTTSKGFSVLADYNSDHLWATTGKTFIRDIDLGTGKRTIDN
jgi:hypothetical protein